MTCPRSLAAKGQSPDYNPDRVVLESCTSAVCFPALQLEAVGPAVSLSVCGRGSSRGAGSMITGSSAVRRCSRAWDGPGRNNSSWIRDEDLKEEDHLPHVW